MARIDHVGYEQAAAISLNYALDKVEMAIRGELESGRNVTPETLRTLLRVIEQQRIYKREFCKLIQ